MGSDDLFEAVSHPMRIEIVKALAEKPLRFADLKRDLKISSSGLLDFHLKKLNDLIITNDEGNYTLTEKGFAALQAVETASKYNRLRAAQKRAFYINLLVCIMINANTLWIANQINDYTIWFTLILPITLAWILFYSYWTLVKRRIRLRT